MSPKIELLNVDCLEYMKTVPDKYFELAIVDPPYGIGMSSKINSITGGVKFIEKHWDDSPPSDYYFKQLYRVSKNQIIWGCNYFNLKPTPCILVWDKHNGDSLFADAELAWTSFNSPVRVKKIHWCGSSSKHETGVNKIHPTQKPIKLYKWLLHNYAKAGDKILDTHGGSMSIAIACHQMGFDLTLCEIDKDYYDAGVKRFKEQTMQQTLFK